jgi:hypothetical protein
MNPVEFQYFRDAARRPMVTLCYVNVEDRTYIGIAVCSPKDAPCKAAGRRIAFNRATKAAVMDMNHQVTAGPSLGDGPYRVQCNTDMTTPLWTRYMVVRQPNYRMSRRNRAKLLPKPHGVDIEQLYKRYTERLVQFRGMVDEMAKGLLD